MSENPYAAPQSQVIENDGEGSITHFERFSAWGVFGLSFITLGIYSIYWMYSRTKVLNEITDDPIPESFTNAVLGLYVGNWILSFADGAMDSVALSGLSSLVSLASGILGIIWIFKMKNRVEPFARNFSFSGLLTFFFGAIYVQYKINEAIDASE